MKTKSRKVKYKPVTYAEWLELPPNWVATRFHYGIELKHGDNYSAAIPNPYNPQPKEWWIKQTAKAIKEARKGDKSSLSKMYK